MGRIPDEVIEQLRDRVDMVDLVGRFVSLKKSGRSYKGLCPFHDEKTPSFNVNPDRQAFYCFGCHEGGNAFTFLMKIENLTFPEAVRTLAAQHGIEVPESDASEPGLAERIAAANALAQARYREALAAPGSPGAAYLAGRGIDGAAIERFGVGFAPDRWDFVSRALRDAGVPEGIGERAGLLAARSSGGYYDLLRGRVTFPIRDVRGRIVGFGARAVRSDQQPKYLNTTESPIFRKREAFFGFPFALEPIRRADRAVVVEGYFDCIALHRAGVECVLATCGTALTPEHARHLRRRARGVVLLFDGDEAGQRAMERSLEVLLPQDLRVRTALLPPGEDPDSLLAREGPEALRARLDGAPVALDAVIRRAVSRGCTTPWEKADAVNVVAPLLALLPSRIERSEFARRLALEAGTEPTHVEAAVRAARRGEDPREAVPVRPREQDPEERLLRQLARGLVEHPHLAAGIPSEELAGLAPAGPLVELIGALIEASRAVRAIDLEKLPLRDEARVLLHSLAAEEFAFDEPAASRTIEDTLGKLRAKRESERQQALTRRLRDPDADVSALLREKDEQRRRRAPMGAQP